MGQHFAHDVGGYSILKQEILFDSYNPYDGPNDNPELELPLTAGEYIYVYGDMDDDGFYEGNFGVSTISTAVSYDWSHIVVQNSYSVLFFHFKLQLVRIKIRIYVSDR